MKRLFIGINAGLVLLLAFGTCTTAGTITITRSGASVDEYQNGDVSLADSSYSHGAVLTCDAFYRILLPAAAGGNDISSFQVTVR